MKHRTGLQELTVQQEKQTYMKTCNIVGGREVEMSRVWWEPKGLVFASVYRTGDRDSS